ncbi:uncharacterized protein [Spinacia oleracea]|uniref:DUF4283 domain-containing protein n=1 Tax=Spinacia oleracea TaxID=3562 RepID=A0ABM3R7M3_SPIOL|nr:uncharacterized protein LOC130467201 [Spinacia oleracea]
MSDNLSTSNYASLFKTNNPTVSSQPQSACLLGSSVNTIPNTFSHSDSESVGSHNYIDAPNSPPSHTSHTVPAEIHSESLAVISLNAPRLADDEVSLMEKSCLFGKAWGEFIPQAAILARLNKDWNNTKGEIKFRYLGNGWFLIQFDNPLTKLDVWNGRPWFVQGLNFVLMPWYPGFRAQFCRITSVDQWIKIPFLPTEYWAWRHLNQIVSCIGHPIRLDRFTQQNVEKGNLLVFVLISISPNLFHDQSLLTLALIVKSISYLTRECGKCVRFAEILNTL